MLAVNDEPPRPFFPRYLFCKVECRVDPVTLRYLFGVSNLVRAGSGRFARVDDRVIESIRERETDGVIRVEQRRKKMLIRGEQVIIQFGSNVDLVAKFLRMKGTDRAMVLVRLMGKVHTPIVRLHHMTRVQA
jgi:transcription antitermination factor NusG